MDLVEVLGEELAGQVEEKLDDDVIVVKEENHVTKDSFNDLNEEKKHYQDMYKEAQNKLEELEDLAEENEELKTELKETRKELDNKDDEWVDELAKTKKDAAIEVALANAKHPELLKSQIDYEELEYDPEENEVSGIEDELEKLEENYGDLLGEEEKKEDVGKSTNPGDEDYSSLTMDDIDNMTEEEINENWEEVQKVLS